MKVIIAGSRDLPFAVTHVADAVRLAQFSITEIVSGCALGIDMAGLTFASWFGIPVKKFPADWNNLELPGAVIKYDKQGRPFNATAGHYRNGLMAEYADALVAIWDGKSRGTRDMIQRARKRGLKVYVHQVSK